MTNIEKVQYVLESCRCAVAYSKTMGKEYPILTKEIEEVLSFPKRNFDVGTTDEKVSRFIDYCVHSKRKAGECMYCHNPPSNLMRCLLEWAQMPYEPKGENK